MFFLDSDLIANTIFRIFFHNLLQNLFRLHNSTKYRNTYQLEKKHKTLNINTLNI